MNTPSLYKSNPARTSSASLLRLFVLFSLVFHVLSAAHAATYYIATNGSNNNDGLSTSAPWATIAKANATLQPGDTVIIRGGEYAGANAMIIPANSGTASQPITYQAYPNETPVITDTRTHSDTSANYAIDLTDRAYIVVDGITVDGKQPWLAANVRSWVKMSGSGSHHNIIKNCVLKYARGWPGIQIYPDSHYNQILNCYLDNCGVWDDGNAQDSGDSLIVNGNYNIIEGNVLRHGGHNLMVAKGSFNVIRNNDFDNDWSDIEGPGKGNRSLTLGGSSSATNGYNIFENNVVRNAGVSSDSGWNTLMKAENTNQIVRRNYLYNSVQYGITSNVRGGVPYSQYSRIYHNTFFNLGGPMWQAHFQSNGIDLDNQVIKNNIVYKGRQNPLNTKHDSDIFINLTLDGKVLGANRIVFNSFMKDTSGDSTAFVDTLGNQSLAWMEGNQPNNFSDNLQVGPDFVSSNPVAPEDFELQSTSPMIDAGDFLTVTVGSGSGTQITVADSRYFFDGFGIVDGDLVQIGSNAPVRITSVNYSTHILTVDQSITWGSGNGASLPYNGSAPDIGAWEFGAGASAPSAPSGLTATAIASSQVDLSWSDVSNETQYRIERKTGAGSFGALTPAAVPAANSTSFSDSTVSASTAYTYQIRAENAYGNSGWAASNQVTTPSGGGGGGSGNLLANPGFEATSDWTNFPSSSSQHNGSNAYSGTYRLKITSSDYPEVWQQVAVTPGGIYQASVWNTNWSSGGTARGQMRLDWYQNGVAVGSPVTITATSESPWAQLQSGNITAPTGATTLRMTLKRSATVNGNYYFDEAEISALDVVPDITTTSLPGTIEGESYNQTLAATGGNGALVWSVDSGALPNGLNLSSGGVISGTTTAGGTFNFTVRVADSDSSTGSTDEDTQALSIAVTANSVPAITTSTLPNGTEATAYNETLTATGGNGALAWSVDSGVLPAGLSLSSAGVISGTPTAAGTSNFTVRVTDSDGNTGSADEGAQALSITIDPTGGGGGVNLLANPGFEATSDWTNFPTSSSQHNGSNAYAGTYRLKITGGDYPEVWQQVAVTSGAVYEASVWNTNWSSDGSARGQMRLDWYQNGTAVGSSVTITSTSESPWAQLQSGNITAPTGATHLRMTLKRSATVNGNYYFDEAEITQVSAPPASAFYEAESLTVGATSGDSVGTPSNAAASDGSYVRFDSNQIGDYVTLNVNAPATQTYQITIRLQKTQWTGICQLAIDGVNQGPPEDLYNSSSIFTDVGFGTKSLTAGNHAFRFTVTGKNASATDWEIRIDAISIDP